MTTCYITISVGTSYILATSVTKMQIFIEINNFEGDKIEFKRSYDKQNLTLVIILYEFKLPKGLFNKLHMK